MSITINTKTYTADSYQKDTVVLIGPLKSVSVKDDLRLSRTAPKSTATFSGLGRTSAKLVRGVNLTGALTPRGEVLGTIDVATPVGASGTDVDAYLDDFAAFISSAEFKQHVKTQKINF